MTLGRNVARFNKHFTNRLTGPLVPYLPGFGLLIHTGRTSGDTYRTPVNVFKGDDGFVIALTYGTGSDWVKNVLAAGGCELITRGRHYRLTSPEIFRDQSGRPAPALARPILRLIDARDFLRLRASSAMPLPTESDRRYPPAPWEST